ncbi:MAG: MFS transporter [Desulfobacteraceae bacterium]|nr:MFS transporter [Desulfobacteraceae bacterium]
MAEAKKLLTFEFVAINFVYFFAFCNMAVFYSFFEYLGKLGIPPEWRGLIVGLEPMSACALRLAIIPLLHLGNAIKVMMLALGMLVIALCSYMWVSDIPGLIVLRIFHGAAFVLLVSATMSLVVHLIPAERSAQGFGIVSIASLVPYAVMPLVTEGLLDRAGGEARIYAWITVMAAPGMVLLEVLRRRSKTWIEGIAGTLMKRPRLEEVTANLRQPGIAFLLGVCLFIYFVYSTVFFFMKSFSVQAGLEQGGIFFTICTIMLIAVRTIGGSAFDKVNKIRVLQIVSALLVLCFVLFGQIRSARMYYAMAVYYGLCMGIFMPVLTASLFVASPAHLRGLNANLALFMMDAGFFLSPYLGGALLSSGTSFAGLFETCAVCVGAGLILLIRLERGTSGEKAPT